MAYYKLELELLLYLFNLLVCLCYVIVINKKVVNLVYVIVINKKVVM